MNTQLTKTLFLILLTIPLSSSAQLSDSARIRLDSIFSSWTLGTPGGVACVVDHGNVVYRKGFGLADVKGKIANTPEMRYELASMAKQFTAMCIALLEEQGKISADDNLKKFYPDMHIEEEVKIRHLIDHSSGLREASVLAILSGKMNLKGEVRKNYETKKYYLECFKRETNLNFQPGSELAYTNFNYILLGDIVEKISGQTLSQFADSAIFKTLGMTHTIFRDRRDMHIPGEARGYLYTRKKIKLQKPVGGIVGDHNLVSSLDDLVKWELNFDHNILGKRDPGLIKKICTSSSFTNGKPSNYGYGLWLYEYRGMTQVTHGGDDGRHTTMAARFPEHELIVIVFGNSSRYNETQQKTYAIVDVMLKDKLEPIPKKETFKFITLPEKELQSLVGLYTMIDERGLARQVNVVFVAPDLYYSPSSHWRGFKLNPVSSDYFVAYDYNNNNIQLRFSGDPANRTVTFNYMKNPERTYALLKDTPVKYDEYKGIFSNKSTGVTLKLKTRKGKLVATKGIILKIPLIPFGPDQFYGPENDVLFIFERDTQGRVKNFKANAPDFRRFVFTRRD